VQISQALADEEWHRHRHQYWSSLGPNMTRTNLTYTMALVSMNNGAPLHHCYTLWSSSAVRCNQVDILLPRTPQQQRRAASGDCKGWHITTVVCFAAVMPPVADQHSALRHCWRITADPCRRACKPPARLQTLSAAGAMHNQFSSEAVGYHTPC
jgi:hypothetical protein